MVEDLILSNLVHNEEYGRKVVPFLRPEYFHDKTDKVVFKLIQDHIQQYNTFPNNVALKITAGELKGFSQDEHNFVVERIEKLAPQQAEVDWLVDQTEKFCKDKAIYNAISASIKMIDEKDGQYNPSAIPKILEDALAVSFDVQIGHNFFDDAKQRYDFYHKEETRIPFDLSYFNKITKGGLPRKTLNVILAGTGVGKSLFMCHCAASNIAKGLNVLYITMEMAEERIAERIDANLLNVSLDKLTFLSEDDYITKVSKLKDKFPGNLIIKEYPTASAGSSNFRHLLNELKLKKKFKPDIIYVDYLNICNSSRLKNGVNVNSYTYVKAIAEELRGLAVEFDVPIVSATQTTRSGYTSSDIGLEDTSESFGLPATVDFMFALISTEELEELNQIMVKQLKNRYADPTVTKRFVVGVDRAKMKLYDVEQVAQHDVLNDTPVFDRSKDKLSKDVFKGFS